MSHSFINSLINASSPYLLQHAHNPVNWYQWNEEALKKAKLEDKPIIISIGYSACHWCHVMERECFENESLARLMNENFICIKVDREERPDIDQIYMDAVQNMGIRGGWPLNVFLTSQAEPFYGGTYFPPQQWQSILLQVSNAYQNHRDQIEDSANGFTKSLNRSETEKFGLSESANQLTLQDIEHAFTNFEKQFDRKEGGMNKAPKFPMPSNYFFMLRIWNAAGNSRALDHVMLTLKKMALGGIYDQAGGGFARYSTDSEWFLPHFEKMLYDNGQLISLYSEAYLVTKEPLFKEVVYETIAFVKRELTSYENGFFSALDADSEGEEGKFYVWTISELEELITDDFQQFCQYYNIEAHEGNWESGNNILFSYLTPSEYCQKNNIDSEEFKKRLSGWKKILLEKRNQRERPGLDDKILTSWNGIMLNGLIDAYRVFDETGFLTLAIKNASFIIDRLKSGADLYHSYKNGVPSIHGFLEDYAFVIQAFINIYQATFDEKWLNEATILTDNVLIKFIDEEEDFLYFTSSDSEKLIARKREIFDNVIPSSNSVMATNLYWLGILRGNALYIQLSDKMLSKVKSMIVKEPNYLSNWGNLLCYNITPTKEVAISGEKFIKWREQIDKFYVPNKVYAGTNTSSELGLLKERNAVENKTIIYVCENNICQLPVESVEEAIELLLN